jgi:hypothetical protein
MRKLVALVLAALAGATLAFGGGGTSGKGATHGLVRASSSGTAAGSSFASASATSSFGPNVIDGIYEGESPPVSGLPILPVVPGPLHTRDNESLHAGGSTNAQDPVVQHHKGTGPISAPMQNFDGICLPFGPPCAQPSSCSCLPPDTEGEVGATQYVQAVNTDFAVYSKNGAVLRAATPINELWANTNGECKLHNDGDPVVVYDQLARRWLISQFIATPSGSPGDDQYGECIAVSTSSDATGSYYLYEFDFGTDVFFDYPKLGVWPDGYYMMANEFPTNSETSAGVGVFAFERSKMGTRRSTSPRTRSSSGRGGRGSSRSSSPVVGGRRYDARGAGSGASRAPGCPWQLVFVRDADLREVFAAPAVAPAEGCLEVDLGERNSRPFESSVCGSAAPSPVERIADQAGSDRIAGDVARCSGEVLLALDLADAWMSTEEVRASLVHAVQVARVLRVQPLQGDRKAGIGDSEKRVVVVPHQGVREQGKLEALADRGEPGQEVLALAVADKELAIVAAVRGQVVDAG